MQKLNYLFYSHTMKTRQATHLHAILNHLPKSLLQNSNVHRSIILHLSLQLSRGRLGDELKVTWSKVSIRGVSDLGTSLLCSPEGSVAASDLEL